MGLLKRPEEHAIQTKTPKKVSKRRVHSTIENIPSEGYIEKKIVGKEWY
jgi:hypothetical protein